MESAISRAFSFDRALLRNHFCRDNLEGESDRRDQDEESVNRGGVTKSSRTQESRDRDVVCEINPGDQPRAREQDETARKNAGPQSLRFRVQTIQHGVGAPAQLKG